MNGAMPGSTRLDLVPEPAARRPAPDPGLVDEAELVRALCRPDFYPHRPPTVEHVQTHISHVFLAGPYAYKLKKPVRLPFVDAGTPERRRRLCEDELRLNWRLAAPVYLGVLPVTRDPSGALTLDGRGAVVDRVVWMRRLPAARMLDALITAGEADASMLECLAHLLADFHASTPSQPAVTAHGSPDALLHAWSDVLHLADALPPDVLSPAARQVLGAFARGFVDRHRPLLERRQSGRRIREGHGDLRAEHVCILDAPVLAPAPHAALAPGIYIVDCLEFSEALRCSDVASEIAFLAMDLERLGRADFAAAFVADYVAASGDRELPTLLPFYVAYRACVRGAVDGVQAADADIDPAARAVARQRAGSEFALALRHAWAERGPAMIACCGLSGSGKTTLAAALAEMTGWPHVSTDVLRGRAPEPGVAAYGGGRYTAEARAAIYARLCEETDRALSAGCGVIADATFIRRADRDALAAVAARHGRPLLFVECEADATVVRARLAARQDGPSDARWATHLQQREARDAFAATEPHLVVRTDRNAATALDDVLPVLWRWRAAGP